MLFLSLWPPMERQPTKQELYQRCHEMGDIVVEGLKAADGAAAARLMGADGTAPAKRAGIAKRAGAEGEIWYNLGGGLR